MSVANNKEAHDIPPVFCGHPREGIQVEDEVKVDPVNREKSCNKIISL